MFSMLMKLQTKMASVVKSVGNIEHEVYPYSASPHHMHDSSSEIWHIHVHVHVHLCNTVGWMSAFLMPPQYCCMIHVVT